MRRRGRGRGRGRGKGQASSEAVVDCRDNYWGRVGAGERRVKDSDRDGWLEYQRRRTVNGGEDLEDEVERIDE